MLIIRSLAFNARNTAHRGLRFNFHGKYLGALLGYLLMPALGVATLGLLLPVGAWFRARYLVSNSTFGATGFNQQLSLLAFHAAYARAALLLVVLVVPTLAVAAASYGPGLRADLMLLPAYLEQMEDRGTDPTSDDTGTESSAGAPPPLLDEAQTERAEKALLALLMLFYALFALAAIVWVYIRTAVTNLTWDGARLGPLGFVMQLRFGRMLWLKISNLLAIVLSFGLAVPWARIRTARYVTSCVLVLGLEDANTLLGGARETGSVIGEELGDVFDVDLGF